MTAEQLEERVSELADRMRLAYGGQLARDCTETLQSLARRVIAAEKLVEAGRVMAEALKGHYIVPGSAAAWDDAHTAYREASK